MDEDREAIIKMVQESGWHTMAGTRHRIEESPVPGDTHIASNQGQDAGEVFVTVGSIKYTLKHLKEWMKPEIEIVLASESNPNTARSKKLIWKPATTLYRVECNQSPDAPKCFWAALDPKALDLAIDFYFGIRL
jgi:hypothetical protein